MTPEVEFLLKKFPLIIQGVAKIFYGDGRSKGDGRHLRQSVFFHFRKMVKHGMGGYRLDKDSGMPHIYHFLARAICMVSRLNKRRGQR